MPFRPSRSFLLAPLALLLLLAAGCQAQVPKPVCSETKALPAAAPALSPSEASPGGLDPRALERLVERGVKSRSDALVVLHEGRVAPEWYFGKPPRRIEAMSATKSIVSLAVGQLIDQGKIRSLDEPVSTFFPEWSSGLKAKVTLRHLLNHTSGLKADRRAEEIYRSPDFVRLALDSEVVDEPGTRFFYNNSAVNLLAGVVERASGEKMDDLLRRTLFAPLGISDVRWARDAAGNPHAMAGLQIRPLDLARVGQMLLDGGVSGGVRIISEAYLRAASSPSQPLDPSCGLLFWTVGQNRLLTIDDSVIDAWRKAGVDEGFIARVLPIKDRRLLRSEFFPALEPLFGGLEGMELWHRTTWRRGLPDSRVLERDVVGYKASGSLGQYLVVLPSARIVGVRMRQNPGLPPAEAEKDTASAFTDFDRALLDLVPDARPPR